MNRRFGTNIFFLFFAFAVTGFGIKATLPFYAATTENTKTENLSSRTAHVPDAEFDGIRLPATGMHITAQKNMLQLHLSSISFQKNISSENLQIKESALLPRDYLSYIYPSHNFW